MTRNNKQWDNQIENYLEDCPVVVGKPNTLEDDLMTDDYDEPQNCNHVILGSQDTKSEKN